MKVYRFYIKRKHVPPIFDNTRGNPNDWVLYAYTNEKDLATMFQDTRSAKRFRKVVSSMKKGEFDQFSRSSQMQRLSMQEYINFDKELDANGQRQAGYVPLVLTLGEQETLQSIMDSGLVKEFDFFCPVVFKDDYYEALKLIQYVASFKLWVSSMDSHSLYEISLMLDAKDHGETDYSAPNIDYDEVAMIVDLFESTW